MIRLHVPFFTVLFFISATLVFSVQPMLGKMMLPYVGGSPAGWIVAMAFFQIALLAGYTLAHLCSKLNVFTHSLATLAILLLGLFFVPIDFNGEGLTDIAAITPLTVFVKLALVASIPFIALSSIAPGFQRVFSAGKHHTAKDPYYFYAASNLGSFFGLLSYPFLVEPFFTLATQASVWMWLYIVLIVLSAVSSLLIFMDNKALIHIGLRHDHLPAEQTGQETGPDLKTFLRWLMLAAIPSSLILGVTTYMTTNIASIPLLWIIPLGLYLVSHIIAFSKKPLIQDTLLTNLTHAALIISALIFYLSPLEMVIDSLRLLFFALFFLSAFFTTAVLLHVKLANERPPARHLTVFYLALSLGGALGGSFNAFIAPAIFNNTYEFPLALLASLFFNTLWARTSMTKRAGIVMATVTIAAFIFAAYCSNHTTELVETFSFLSIRAVNITAKLATAVFFIAMFINIVQIRIAALCALIVLGLQIVFFMPSRYDTAHRNFFGISHSYRTTFALNKKEKKKLETRVFMHGDTLHGLQAIDPLYETTAFSYYMAHSAPGHALYVSKARKVGVIGLGAGVLSCYNRYFPDLNVTFFEIDPYVKDVALNEFTFLKKCGYEKILLGDGRLLIENLPKDETFDVLFIDAFTSDAIPLHLLTKEALQSYLDRMTPDGLMIFHVSNRYLDLSKPLPAIANALNKHAYFYYYISDSNNALTFDSQWVMITNSDRYHKTFEQAGWEDLTTLHKDAQVWTDAYSNIVTALRIKSKKQLAEDAAKWSPVSEDLRHYMYDAIKDTQKEINR